MLPGCVRSFAMSATASIIEEHLDEIRALCRTYRVERLELFGSAANGQFDEGRSDLDFLVTFALLSPSDRADAYFGLLAALQDLFGREVDLVESQAIDNPYFQQSVEAGRRVLYAA